LERDEEKIKRWKQRKWPRVKNRCAAGRPYRICRRIRLPFDPLRGQDLGTEGKNSIHRHRQGRRDKISVISGISLSPKRQRVGLYYLLFFENIGQQEVCIFLREVLRNLRGPVIVLLDNQASR
jgi:hypothetical protein